MSTSVGAPTIVKVLTLAQAKVTSSAAVVQIMASASVQGNGELFS